MKKLLLGILAALVAWFAITRLYMHLSPFGSIESLAISIAISVAAVGIIEAIAKASGKPIPPALYIIVVIITTTAYLLLSINASGKIRELKINCDTHKVRGKRLNRGEKVKIRYLYTPTPQQPQIPVHITFSGLLPLWLNNAQVKDIDGKAPGLSSEIYKVNGPNQNFNFTFTCGTDTEPSGGMIQIPRQYSLFPPDDDDDY